MTNASTRPAWLQSLFDDLDNLTPEEQIVHDARMAALRRFLEECRQKRLVGLVASE